MSASTDTTKHTPGPWRVSRHNADRPGLGWILETETNTVIGRINDAVDEIDPYTHIPVRSETTDANARLIAAAPELLECAEAYMEFLWSEWHATMTQAAFDNDPEVVRVRAAIKKARGE